MMVRKSLLMGMAIIVLALIAACTPAPPTPEATATPVVVIQTVVVKETVPVEVEKPVEVIVTKEVEKEVEKLVTVEVEKEVTVVKTVEVEKTVEVVKTVEVAKVVTVEVQVTTTPTPEPTADRTHPKVREVLNEIPLVQYHHDATTDLDSFTCASRGLGIMGVKPDAQGPRFVGPNSGDFDLWGVAALFKVSPDGQIELVTQESGGRFFDPEGIEHTSFTLEQALALFASGDAKWLGTQSDAGRVADCNPRYETPTPEG